MGARVIRFFNTLYDRLLFLALIILLLIGVYFIYDTAYVYYHAEADRVTYQKPGADDGDGDSRPFTDDYVAWLSLDDTDIDFPVMQADDNTTYLNTDPYGDYSLSGSIFLDSRNSSDFSDSYSLVYGHHMSGGLMFGALDSFFDEDFFDEHLAGTLETESATYELRVFAIIDTNTAEKIFFDPDTGEEGSASVISLAEEISEHYRQPESDHILALSTCATPADTRRTVLLCSMAEKR